MSTERVSFSPGRMGLIAGNTFLEAVRQRLFLFLALLAVALVGGAQFFHDFHFGPNFGAPELKFTFDFGMGALVFFGSALAVAATAQLFFSEIENRTALTLLAKPVWRAEFVFGKFLGVWAVLGVFCVLLAGLLAALLARRAGVFLAEDPDVFAHGGRITVADVFIVAVLHWIKFGVLAMITLLVASFSNTNLFTVVMGFFVLVICHLQALAHRAYAKVEASSVVLGLLIETLARVFPNFQLFSLEDMVGQDGGVDGLLALRVAGYGLAYIVVFGLVAVFSFRRREI
jgi:ABC-type transport system involved in multi-copper enzyme maturation permease subunit